VPGVPPVAQSFSETSKKANSPVEGNILAVDNAGEPDKHPGVVS